jgi:NAD(P)-dependent dehydrogenase (short-subunit alcohol dehydrogenase family)
MSRLKDKFTLITGGTSGIGLETARQFLAEGAHVAITGRSERGLEQASRDLGGDVLCFRSDAGLIADQKELAKQLSHQWPHIDVAFLNAADVTHHPMEAWDEETYDKILAVNLKGPFFLLQQMLPLFANPASVILCGSASAHIGLSQSSAYAASKAGLLSLARTLSGEWIERGIRVNGLSPGPTATSALQRLGLPQDEEAALVDQIRKLVPIGRLGSPMEIAKAAVFLASDESTFVVGSELLVDGGVASL